MAILLKGSLKPLLAFYFANMALCRKNGPCEYLCYTLLFLAILPLQTLPYQNRVVGNFSSCMHGCHFEFKMADLYSFLQGSKNQVEKHVILFV